MINRVLAANEHDQIDVFIFNQDISFLDSNGIGDLIAWKLAGCQDCKDDPYLPAILDKFPDPLLIEKETLKDMTILSGLYLVTSP